MGNLECNLGHIFAGCCYKDEEENEDKDDSKKAGNTSSYNELKRNEAGGDVFDAGHIKGNQGGLTMINQNNQGISSVQTNIKGNINYITNSAVSTSSNGYQPVPNNSRNEVANAITEN